MCTVVVLEDEQLTQHRSAIRSACPEEHAAYIPQRCSGNTFVGALTNAATLIKVVPTTSETAHVVAVEQTSPVHHGR